MRVPLGALDDPRVEAYRSLRDRDLRDGHGGVFVAEGEVVLRVLLGQARYPLRSILVSEQQAARLDALLQSVDPAVPIFVAAPPLLEAIIGFSLHRGVLALGERRAAEAIAATGPSLVLGLCGITNHDNVGGIFRNAAAFGVDGVLLDGATCDPLYRKALRVSVGGSLIVPFAELADEAAVVDRLLESGHEVLALSPRGELVIGRDRAPHASRVALLLGAEGTGLTKATLARCPSARIPMHGTWDSLNVAVTSGIALAWLRSPSAA